MRQTRRGKKKSAETEEPKRSAEELERGHSGLERKQIKKEAKRKKEKRKKERGGNMERIQKKTERKCISKEKLVAIVQRGNTIVHCLLTATEMETVVPVKI